MHKKDSSCCFCSCQRGGGGCIMVYRVCAAGLPSWSFSAGNTTIHGDFEMKQSCGQIIVHRRTAVVGVVPTLPNQFVVFSCSIRSWLAPISSKPKEISPTPCPEARTAISSFDIFRTDARFCVPAKFDAGDILAAYLLQHPVKHLTYLPTTFRPRPLHLITRCEKV